MRSCLTAIGGVVVVLIAASIIAAAVANKSTTGPTSSPALITNSTEATTTTSPPSRPQVFRGAGTENLGTLSVATSSTLEWTCRGCTIFVIEGHTNDFSSIIDIDNSDHSSGVSAVEPGTYESVNVAADEGETNAGWTIEVRSR